MKIAGYAVLGFILLFVADRTVTGLQADRFLQRVGSERPFEELTSKVKVGMDLQDVEALLTGFRDKRASSNGETYTVSYEYWFGFLPPKGLYRLKIWGGIIVTYSKQDKVTDVSYWYN